MASERVNVSIDESYRDRFSEVVERSQKAGLKVEQQLKEIGIVTGSIEPGKLADLERVEGVAAVAADRNIRIAPPESDVQ